MATTIVNLKVFVASPSDVSDERLTLEQVIKELNKMPGERLGIRLDLVKWETDSYPSFGENAQSVINEQIGDDYDIFIGIIWKRFGIPTNKQESGTVEEFQRAYERAIAKPNEIKIMFYFKDSPVSPSELDLEQYIKIDEFRKKIGKQGVYYWSYKKPEDFEAFVRLHLGKVMEGFGNDWGKSVETKEKVANIDGEPHKSLAVDTTNDTEIEDGFLDLIISSVEDMNSAGESISRIRNLLEELNKKTINTTEEINKLSKPINPNEARLLVNRQADTWEDFALRAETELPILSTRFRTGIHSYTRSAQLLEDFENKDKDQVVEALNAIKKLKSVVTEAQLSTENLRAITQKLPRMSVRLNHAKRHLLEVLDKIIEEYKMEENLATEAEKIIVDVLERIDLPKN